MLFYSVRTSPQALPPLAGPGVHADPPLAQEADDMLLGAVDSVEAGEVRGWACRRGAPADDVQAGSLHCQLSMGFIGPVSEA